MKRLPILLLVVALSVVVVRELQYAGARKDWAIWEADTVRLLADLNVNRSRVGVLEQENASLRAQVSRDSLAVVRGVKSLQRLQTRTDSLFGVLSGSQNGPDSLYTAILAIESLQASLDTTLSLLDRYRSITEAQQRELVNLRVSDSLGWAGVDSLTRLVRSTPKTGCPRLFGVPLPHLGVGYGLGPRGMGPVVALVVPLGSCGR